ncbi:hypothetical protein PAI11_18330 [Patulibacter medicamentivorans]|uniref:GIY-YIG domain-containing protein n=1 Tax=Patulibacter medicamentivorans TaxID=1097667 RepID=H0E4V2_9ACTN|nr:hypothetical protein PAI11_18330 [Patulibacter medicamentivorans]
MRRDITKPSSGSIGGQLNTVSRKWTNRRDTIPVTVRASDSHSGVARVALSAQRVGSGRTIDLGTATPPCDRGCKTTSSTVPVDLSRLDRDGRYRLRLQVTDRAGNQRSFTVGPQLKIDRGAPRPIGPAPTYTVRNDGSVRVLFTPSRDPQPGSGRIRLYMVRYYPAPTTDAPLAPATARFARIRVASARAATTKESRFRKSRSRAITFHPAKDGIDTDRPVALVELDDTSGVFAPPEQADGEQGVPGERRATPRFLTEQELWKLQGLDKVENAGKLLANAPKTAPVLRPVLRGLVKGVGRSAILALVGSLVFPESTGCDARPTPGMFNSQARTAFDAARAAISRAASAPAGRNTTIRRSVARARKLFRALQPAIDTQIRLYGDPCDRAGKVGQAGKDAISPALQASYRHLNDLSVQKQRADARKWAKARSRRQTVPETHCRDARKLEGRWSKSSGYVVYWSPAPPPDASVRYVGISRSLRSRCSKHPEYRRFGLTTLKLPHLTSEEAHNVEEALIAHWGHGREGGQLLGNKIHSIRPERPEYCTRLLRGQSLLVLFGYGRYASAHFTRTKRCIGVG